MAAGQGLGAAQARIGAGQSSPGRLGLAVWVYDGKLKLEVCVSNASRVKARVWVTVRVGDGVWGNDNVRVKVIMRSHAGLIIRH